MEMAFCHLPFTYAARSNSLDIAFGILSQKAKRVFDSVSYARAGR